MNYEKLVPSRALCEEMARLGICQDGAELWWCKRSDRENFDYWCVDIEQRGWSYNLIAPTLASMMDDLLSNGCRVAKDNNMFYVQRITKKLLINLHEEDKDLKNVCAKALIATARLQRCFSPRKRNNILECNRRSTTDNI